MTDEAIQQHLHAILSRRTPPKTACPSEVARALSKDELAQAGCSDWREAMTTVRSVAASMRPDVEVLQKGEVLPADADLSEVKGPIRLRYSQAFFNQIDGQ